ncbi:MAG: site-specific integrase [Acidimicrobiales bacterium]
MEVRALPPEPASTALAALVTEAQKGQVAGTNATVAYLMDEYSAIRQVHALLSGAFGQAVRWGWAPVNPAKAATPPVIRQRRIEPPAPAQVEALVREAEKRDPILAVLIMLAALTGARRGELCALRWSDVDLAAGTVRISRSLVDLTGRLEEKDTKTHQERTVSLGDPGVALLTLHRRQVLKRAKVAEAKVAPDAFVFSDRLDWATPVRPTRLTGFFTRLRDDLKLPDVHLHSLRHFMASQLAARGDVSVRTLAGRLGHADGSVTMRVYAAFFPAADAEAAEHMGRILSRRSKGVSEPRGTRVSKSINSGR